MKPETRIVFHIVFGERQFSYSTVSFNVGPLAACFDDFLLTEGCAMHILRCRTLLPMRLFNYLN